MSGISCCLHLWLVFEAQETELSGLHFSNKLGPWRQERWTFADFDSTGVGRSRTPFPTIARSKSESVHVESPDRLPSTPEGYGPELADLLAGEAVARCALRRQVLRRCAQHR